MTSFNIPARIEWYENEIAAMQARRFEIQGDPRERGAVMRLTEKIAGYKRVIRKLGWIPIKTPRLGENRDGG